MNKNLGIVANEVYRANREIEKTGWKVRDIRLADILYTLWRKNPANRTLITVECSGQFLQTVFKGKIAEKILGPQWNLLDDDLTHQSDSMLNYLAELLAY